MRIVRVSIFILLAAMLALIGATPQRILAERGAMHSRTEARTDRRLVSQQQSRRRKPQPKPQQQTPTPLLTADNAFPSFPKQIAGTTSAPVIVTITNTSTTVTVTISSVMSDNADFTTSGCLTALAPNATCQLSITFKPNAQAVCGDVASINIVSNDPAGPLALDANSFAATPGGLVTDDLRDQALTASDLAQALVGTGVSISNVTYTGAPIAAGTFKGGASIIGFDSGIILSNGAVSNVIGPNCDTGITWVNNTAGDADLTAIIGQQTNDAAVLEFDFNPSSPTIRFQYVFASDEYQEFVFDFNDVFAFFVNGTNIALIPQTNTIVSINNVNNGSTDPANLGIPPVNPSFYVNNDFQFPTAAPFNTEMDGLTVVLTATAKVNPGVNNHIKLAVADALDFVYDSNVFIKGGSLSSTVVSLSPTGLAFGNQNVGGSSAAQTVTLTNVGTAALSGVSVATSSSVFTQTNTCAADVAPGGNLHDQRKVCTNGRRTSPRIIDYHRQRGRQSSARESVGNRDLRCVCKHFSAEPSVWTASHRHDKSGAENHGYKYWNKRVECHCHHCRGDRFRGDRQLCGLYDSTYEFLHDFSDVDAERRNNTA